jgi:hypothetical protein
MCPATRNSRTHCDAAWTAKRRRRRLPVRQALRASCAQPGSTRCGSPPAVGRDGGPDRPHRFRRESLERSASKAVLTTMPRIDRHPCAVEPHAQLPARPGTEHPCRRPPVSHPLAQAIHAREHSKSNLEVPARPLDERDVRCKALAQRIAIAPDRDEQRRPGQSELQIPGVGHTQVSKAIECVANVLLPFGLRHRMLLPSVVLRMDEQRALSAWKPPAIRISPADCGIGLLTGVSAHERSTIETLVSGTSRRSDTGHVETSRAPAGWSDGEHAHTAVQPVRTTFATHARQQRPIASIPSPLPLTAAGSTAGVAADRDELAVSAVSRCSMRTTRIEGRFPRRSAET